MNYTTIAVEKTSEKLLKTTAYRLGYHSISEYIIALHNARLKMGWNKQDLFALATWGKIPVAVTGKTPQECAEKLGIKKMPTSQEFFKKTEKQ